MRGGKERNENKFRLLRDRDIEQEEGRKLIKGTERGEEGRMGTWEVIDFLLHKIANPSLKEYYDATSKRYVLKKSRESL